MNITGRLERFLEAQEGIYQTALLEITTGRKRSHWMWFIFPQLAGLGFSSMAQRYAIQDLSEACSYLEHPLLGERLIEISTRLLTLSSNDPSIIFGSPDDLKLRSSMTLFSRVPGADPVFGKVLEKFYSGQPDPNTLRLLG